MKITKRQLEILIEKTTKQFLNEAAQGQKLVEFYEALNSFMSAWEWEGADNADDRPVSSKLKALRDFNPAIAKQIAHLWQEILEQVELARTALSMLSYDARGEDMMDAAWQAANKADENIMKILRPHLKAAGVFST